MGTSKRALLLKDEAAGPRGGVPSPPSLFSKEGEAPALGFTHPPHTCSPHTVILLSCPRRPVWARSSLGSTAGVTFWGHFLAFRDSCRKKGTGCSLQSPFFSAPLPPPTPRNPGSPPWLEPDRWGEEASWPWRLSALRPGLGGPLLPPPPGKMAPSPPAPTCMELCKATGPSVSPGRSVWGKEPVCPRSVS